MARNDDIKRQAIAVICKTIQGGREYNEILVRMNSNGNKRQKTARGNSDRIRKSLGLQLEHVKNVGWYSENEQN